MLVISTVLGSLYVTSSTKICPYSINIHWQTAAETTELERSLKMQ